MNGLLSLLASIARKSWSGAIGGTCMALAVAMLLILSGRMGLAGEVLCLFARILLYSCALYCAASTVIIVRGLWRAWRKHG